MLSPSAEKLISEYFNLPFSGTSGVRCPYFNNSRLMRRGQLRALIGKGTPSEIVEEAKIISIQYHKGVVDKDGACCIEHIEKNDKPEEYIRRFLIENNLGIDCSGFITHVLVRHFNEAKNTNFLKKFTLPKTNFIRWIISRLRPIEHMGVAAYANDFNSTEIKLDEIAPADLIIMLETGPKNDRNHMLLVTEKESNFIRYTHARAWSSEGRFGHGVSEGKIRIVKPNGGLLDQEWEEKNETGDKNETFLEAKQAKALKIKRIKI